MLRVVARTVLLAAVVAGCDGSPAVVPRSELEATLRGWLSAHDLSADAVHCPADVPMTRGHTFDCTCEVHGATIPVAVEVTDPATGTLSWEPKYLTLPKATVEDEIRAADALAGEPVTVDCRDPVWISIPGSRWACDLTVGSAAAHRYVVSVTFTDGEGGHTIAIAPG